MALTVRELGDLLIYLGALATALVGVGALLRWVVVQPMRRWVGQQIQEQVRGPLEQTASEVGRITAEVHPNHGSSMRDAIDRTEKQVDRTEREVCVLAQRFDDHLLNHPGPTGGQRPPAGEG